MNLKTPDRTKVVKYARKQARRRLTQARITATRTRSVAQAKTSTISKKAVAAAGVVGLVAGYFLRGRGAAPPSETEYRTGQADVTPAGTGEVDEVPATESLVRTG